MQRLEEGEPEQRFSESGGESFMRGGGAAAVGGDFRISFAPVTEAGLEFGRFETMSTRTSGIGTPLG